MHLNKGYLGKKHCFVAKVSHLTVHLLISVMEWEGHQFEYIKKLRATLDKEFEYVDNEFSTIGFKSMVKRLLKIKRSKLKIKFLGKKT
jgi:hypothetical protein